MLRTGVLLARRGAPPPPAPDPGVGDEARAWGGRYFGCPLDGQTVINWQIKGGSSGSTTKAQLFRARKSGPLSWVRWYIRRDTGGGGSGYSASDGGETICELYEADEATGLPKGLRLGVTAVNAGETRPLCIGGNANSQVGGGAPGWRPKWHFSSPPTLVKGRLYALVQKNVNGQYLGYSGYISSDPLTLYAALPYQNNAGGPYLSGSGAGLELYNGSWRTAGSHGGFFEQSIAGTVYGSNSLFSNGGFGRALTSSTPLRHRWTQPWTDNAVTLWALLWKVSGDNPGTITARLKAMASGSTLATVSIPGSGLPTAAMDLKNNYRGGTAPVWTSYSVPGAPQLTQGAEYALELTINSGTARTHGIQRATTDTDTIDLIHGSAEEYLGGSWLYWNDTKDSPHLRSSAYAMPICFRGAAP